MNPPLGVLARWLLLGCSVPHAEHDVSADQARIGMIIQDMAMANNRGDVDAWVGNFDVNAVYMPPGLPAVTDPDSLEEMARSGFNSFQAAIAIEPVEIVVLGAWAFARARVTGRATPVGGGTPTPIDNKELIVLRRQSDGGWKIARLILNANR